MLLSLPAPLSPCEDGIKGRPSVCKAGGQLSPEPCRLGSLNLDFQPPAPGETIVENPGVFGSFVTGKNGLKPLLTQYAIYLHRISSSHSCTAPSAHRGMFAGQGRVSAHCCYPRSWSRVCLVLHGHSLLNKHSVLLLVA